MCLRSAAAIGNALRYNIQRDSGQWGEQKVPPLLGSLHVRKDVCIQELKWDLRKMVSAFVSIDMGEIKRGMPFFQPIF